MYTTTEREMQNIIGYRQEPEKAYACDRNNLRWQEIKMMSKVVRLDG